VFVIKKLKHRKQIWYAILFQEKQAPDFEIIMVKFASKDKVSAQI